MSSTLDHKIKAEVKIQNLFTIYSKKDDKIFRVISKLRQSISLKLWMLPATLNIKQSGDGIIIRERSKITSSRHKGGGVSEKMILDYVGGGRGIAKDDG